MTRSEWLELRKSQEAKLLAAGVPLREIIRMGKDVIARRVAELEAK